jgi:hypothetical protein
MKPPSNSSSATSSEFLLAGLGVGFILILGTGLIYQRMANQHKLKKVVPETEKKVDDTEPKLSLFTDVMRNSDDEQEEEKEDQEKKNDEDSNKEEESETKNDDPDDNDNRDDDSPVKSEELERRLSQIVGQGSIDLGPHDVKGFGENEESKGEAGKEEKKNDIYDNNVIVTKSLDDGNPTQRAHIPKIKLAPLSYKPKLPSPSVGDSGGGGGGEKLEPTQDSAQFNRRNVLKVLRRASSRLLNGGGGNDDETGWENDDEALENTSQVNPKQIISRPKLMLNEDSNVILAQKVWKQCQSYLKLHSLTLSEGFREIDWDARGLIGEPKFNEWTKRQVGIANRAGAKERHALWAFLVAAGDPAQLPTAPLVLEGEDIRGALLTSQSFQLGVSRLLSLNANSSNKTPLRVPTRVIRSQIDHASFSSL